MIASIALGALGYRAFDRYVYEHGVNLDLKLIAVVATALMLGVIGTLIARAVSRRKRSG